MYKQLTIAMAVLGCATAVLAHEAATGIVKERMDGMVVLSKTMKTLLAETQSDTPNPAVFKDAAKALQDHAGQTMTDRFPEGSLDHPSEAKAEIWQNWQRFSTLADQLDLTAQGLALAAGNPISVKPVAAKDNRMLMDFATMGPDQVFTLLGQNCVACHKEFRAKKK